MQPIGKTPTWQEFWDKVKDDPEYFLDDFELSDTEEDIPNVDSDDEALNQTQVPHKEIEEEVILEDIQ